VEGTAHRGGPLPLDAPTTFDVAMEDGTSLRFGCWVALDASVVAGTRPTLPTMPVAALAPPAAAVGRQAPSAVPGPPLDNLDVILDIELPLTVRFGRAEMTLQALTQVGPGSVIDLDRSPDEPVEVLINEKVIARGEVVVVAGNYGVRVTEVTSAADRIRSLGT
jgi:flagellar motor switch protein FliN/FliY